MAAVSSFKSQSSGDKVFDILVNSFLILLALAIVYPLYFVVIASISEPDLVNAGKVILFPKDITFLGYERVFNDSRVWQGYLNTVLYTIGYTVLALFMTIFAGFALSRRALYGRNFLMILFIISLYFQGGLIPQYLVIKEIGLIGSPWVMVILGSLNVFYLIITRAYFETTISEELVEAAKVDGCNNFQFFMRVGLPVSKAIVAVMLIYYAVHQWNSYFFALVYLNDAKLYPLQIILREILVQAQQMQVQLDINSIGDTEKLADLVRFSLIIVSSLPILMIYPFVQKYFVQGIMLGSVKG